MHTDIFFLYIYFCQSQLLRFKPFQTNSVTSITHLAACQADEAQSQNPSIHTAEWENRSGGSGKMVMRSQLQAKRGHH